MKLSVLDQLPVYTEAAQAVRESVALAQAVEQLGYTRFWVAEHHSDPVMACASPEVLVAAIAAQTSSIQVGSGGVMLPYYSSLKVAETFRLLHALYPGRIDLGIGQGPGASAEAMAALKRGVDEPYDQQIRALLHFLTATDSTVRAMPEGCGAPRVWLLGGGTKSVELAASLGLSYCFAQFIQKRCFPEVMQTYRAHFRPSALQAEPCASLAVRVICAEEEAEAHRLARVFWLTAIRAQRALPCERLPALDEALRYEYDEQDQAFLREHELLMVAGTPEQVRTRLLKLADIYAVDELVVLTICPDYTARVRSYELLARAFAL
ncbi:luciferase family oxidoreductase group 1 [Thermosporothrix hazakensis]|uniref:Luciferase family oxidoreductase group 1 n=1 Tax=Thermosporothrix hazakensis TaxID=644383 RepID=A0A326UJI1_THEHA|nr:LLM class flavin-dependent oxidoreductase [Thermosporothrix hazakensis]PZW32653.1 luciferase family oxidoreductase group 1 [Thermosporothrix hazakensis]GCE50006.1 hypothetical protein KTH_48750 [Thermosporothrix hazakensis]